jgi:HD-like signal output (HDOD) protein
MDGATLLGHIRDRYPSTARVILSGYSEDALARRAVPVAHRFLAKPSNASELHSVIERITSLQEVLGTPEIRKIVGAVGELPSLSTTYARLTDAVRDPESSTNTVADIIEEDIAMSAKVLQLVNSAFFGLAQQVTSMQNAVSYLGLETIKNLALASEAFRVFVPDKRIPHSVCESMQDHAQRVASIACALPVEHNVRDVTILAALLHDIGSLFLASVMPDEFCAVRDLVRESGCKTYEAEEKLLGTTHAEIGAYLLGLWAIPNLTVEAIAHHHHPNRVPCTSFDSIVAVYLADYLAHELEAYPQGAAGVEVAEPHRSCMETLGILPRLDEFRELALQCPN